MAVIPGGERLAKWDRKFNTDRVKAILDDEKPTMKINAGFRFGELAAMENATKGVLNADGILRSDYSRYLCFAREVWKAERLFEGDALRVAAAGIVAKWVGQSLAPSTLEKIRDQVFTISAPVPA